MTPRPPTVWPREALLSNTPPDLLRVQVVWGGGWRQKPQPRPLCIPDLCFRECLHLSMEVSSGPQARRSGSPSLLALRAAQPTSFHWWPLPFSGLVTWTKAPPLLGKGERGWQGAGGARGALLWRGGPGQAAGAPCDPESRAPSWNLGFAAVSWAWVGWVGGWMMRWCREEVTVLRGWASCTAIHRPWSFCTHVALRVGSHSLPEDPTLHCPQPPLAEQP